MAPSRLYSTVALDQRRLFCEDVLLGRKKDESMRGLNVHVRTLMFIAAALISAALTILNIGVYLFIVDLRHPDLHALLSLGPSILSLPLFLTVFISRKWHARMMWMLAFASFCGGYIANIKRGPSDGTLFAAFHALHFPPIVFSMLIAILVECSYRLWRGQAPNPPATVCIELPSKSVE